MAVSYARDIRPLFRSEDNAAMSGSFDLSKYDDVKARADDIHARLEEGSMPCDGAWPDDHVQLFKQWIEDGKQA